MRKPIVGLLPLYLELYDLTAPEVRPDIDAAYVKTIRLLEEKGLVVKTVPVCRLEKEFAEAVAFFEAEHADAIITLHLAYSPSLKAESALVSTKLPLIVLDTTPGYTYDQYTPLSALMRNHGIHGVQDMCNRLLRNGKKFSIFAGHMEHSNVLDRVAAAARGAMAAQSLRNARVGLVGDVFVGMGDFQIPFGELERDLGILIIPYDFKEAEKRIAAVTSAEIDAAYTYDQTAYAVEEGLSREVYDRSAGTALGLRKWIDEQKLNALSINYLATEGSNPGLPVMPFTECSQAMARGVGYAGEGDVLTAAFVGALLSAFPETTFTEMFCPDWEHGTVFLSHMGEVNPNVIDGKPRLVEKDFPFTSAKNPTVLYGTLKGGQAVFVNFVPFGKGEYQLTIVPGEVMEIRGENTMKDSVNGWFRPDVSLETLLEEYSRVGASHHSALIYGNVVQELITMADCLGCKCHVISKDR